MVQDQVGLFLLLRNTKNIFQQFQTYRVIYREHFVSYPETVSFELRP